jgi:hypothetical protein
MRPSRDLSTPHVDNVEDSFVAILLFPCKSVP